MKIGNKTLKVLSSCNTLEQLKGATNYYKLAFSFLTFKEIKHCRDLIENKLLIFKN